SIALGKIASLRLSIALSRCYLIPDLACLSTELSIASDMSVSINEIIMQSSAFADFLYIISSITQFSFSLLAGWQGQVLTRFP
ncbi:hypothetical protein, partial [Pseudomonas aeruginosa]|uniref:hypothetical protein n=1 Tax=Pseudomonas aeruginosa TaxID=287 RepID=UPI001CA5740D